MAEFESCEKSLMDTLTRVMQRKVETPPHYLIKLNFLVSYEEDNLIDHDLYFHFAGIFAE